MTKFKIISWALKILISCQLVSIVVTMCIIYQIHDYAYNPPDFIEKISINLLLTCVYTVGLYFTHQSCILFLRRGYFNTKSALYLTRGGYIIMAKALLSLVIISIYIDLHKEPMALAKHLVSSSTFDIMLFIIGFSLVALSDIIKKGEIIKTENDLTL